MKSDRAQLLDDIETAMLESKNEHTIRLIKGTGSDNTPHYYLGKPISIDITHTEAPHRYFDVAKTLFELINLYCNKRHMQPCLTHTVTTLTPMIAVLTDETDRHLLFNKAAHFISPKKNYTHIMADLKYSDDNGIEHTLFCIFETSGRGKKSGLLKVREIHLFDAVIETIKAPSIFDGQAYSAEFLYQLKNTTEHYAVSKAKTCDDFFKEYDQFIEEKGISRKTSCILEHAILSLAGLTSFPEVVDHCKNTDYLLTLELEYGENQDYRDTVNEMRTKWRAIRFTAPDEDMTFDISTTTLYKHFSALKSVSEGLYQRNPENYRFTPSLGLTSVMDSLHKTIQHKLHRDKACKHIALCMPYITEQEKIPPEYTTIVKHALVLLCQAETMLSGYHWQLSHNELHYLIKHPKNAILITDSILCLAQFNTSNIENLSRLVRHPKALDLLKMIDVPFDFDDDDKSIGQAIFNNACHYETSRFDRMKPHQHTSLSSLIHETKLIDNPDLQPIKIRRKYIDKMMKLYNESHQCTFKKPVYLRDVFQTTTHTFFEKELPINSEEIECSSKDFYEITVFLFQVMHYAHEFYIKAQDIVNIIHKDREGLLDLLEKRTLLRYMTPTLFHLTYSIEKEAHRIAFLDALADYVKKQQSIHTDGTPSILYEDATILYQLTQHAKVGEKDALVNAYLWLLSHKANHRDNIQYLLSLKSETNALKTLASFGLKETHDDHLRIRSVQLIFNSVLETTATIKDKHNKIHWKMFTIDEEKKSRDVKIKIETHKKPEYRPYY